ncbi:hypothetical protein AAC387_Pa05g2536 [Persea americana]
MGCQSLFYPLLITFSTAAITYNFIISTNAPLSLDFPGPLDPKNIRNRFFLVDPIVKMPFHKSKPSVKRLFHTAVTASDSVYNAWGSCTTGSRDSVTDPDPIWVGLHESCTRGDPIST